MGGQTRLKIPTTVARSKYGALIFRSKMASEASSQRRSFFNSSFSCFRTRFGHEICQFSTTRNPQNQAFSWRMSSFLRFRRFPFECSLSCFLAASRLQFWCLSEPLGDALGPSWGHRGVFLAVPWGSPGASCWNLGPGGLPRAS